MLALSQRYAAATRDAQRAALEATAQPMLVVGASHTPGTLLGFALAEVAGILIAFVMLCGQVFGRAAAYAGMLGFALLLVFEVLAWLLSMAWYVLLARRLFQLA